MKWLAAFPSTNARILVSIVLSVAVVIAAVIHWTEPPVGLLVFVGAMMGLDVVQFATKRMTHVNGAEPPTP